MRISDWSSDVCSSDLAGLTAPLHLTADGKALLARMTSAEVSAWLGEDLPPRTDRSKGLGALLTELEDIRRSGFAYDDEEHTDRKSVVTGKSVAVRVDSGGRRLIKKKTTKYKNT